MYVHSGCNLGTVSNTGQEIVFSDIHPRTSLRKNVALMKNTLFVGWRPEIPRFVHYVVIPLVVEFQVINIIGIRALTVQTGVTKTNIPMKALPDTQSTRMHRGSSWFAIHAIIIDLPAASVDDIEDKVIVESLEKCR